jgi:hypothetical protein
MLLSESSRGRGYSRIRSTKVKLVLPPCCKRLEREINVYLINTTLISIMLRIMLQNIILYKGKSPTQNRDRN